MPNNIQIPIDFKIPPEVNKSLKGIEKNVKKISRINLKTVISGFTAMGTGIVAVNQALELGAKLYRGIVGPMSKVVSLAAQQQRVEFLLASTLKQKGIYTQELQAQLVDQAAALQRVTTFGDEQIIQTQRTLLQLGVQTDQLYDVTQATLDFAAAKEVDLATAAELVSKTIGSTTNALSRYGIQITNSADSTLRAADVVSKISDIFGGSAQAEAQTFAGATKQLDNVFGDFLETLGSVITENPLVIQAIKGLSDLFVDLQKFVKANKDEIIKFVNEGLIYLFKSLKELAGFIDKYDIKTLGLDVANNNAELLAGKIANVKKQLELIQKGGFLGEVAAFGLPPESKLKADLATYEEALVKANEKAGDTFLGKVSTGLDKVIKKIETSKIEVSGKTEVVIEQKTRFEEFIEQFKRAGKSLQGAFSESTKQIVAGAGKFFAIVQGGAAGATKLYAKAADALLPGLGQAVQFFGQSTDQFRQQLDGFINQMIMLPQFIADNIPIFIEKIIEAIPDIIDGINALLPQLVENLGEMLSRPSFWKSVIEAFISLIKLYFYNVDFWIPMITAITAGFIAEIPNMAKAFVDALVEEIKGALEGLVPGAGGALGGLGKFFSGSGFGGFGFQHGGEVPSNARYENDRFPARLSSGENVVDRTTNERMKNMLNYFEAGGLDRSQPLTVNLQVGEKELANVLLNLERRGFRTA